MTERACHHCRRVCVHQVPVLICLRRSNQNPWLGHGGMLDILHWEAAFSGISDRLLACVLRGVRCRWRQQKRTPHGRWDFFFGEHGAAEEIAEKDGATHMGRMPQSMRSVMRPVQSPVGGDEDGGEDVRKDLRASSARASRRRSQEGAPCCLGSPCERDRMEGEQ